MTTREIHQSSIRQGMSVKAKFISMIIIISATVFAVVAVSLWFNSITRDMMTNLANSAKDYSSRVKTIQQIVKTSLNQEGIWNNSLDADEEELKVFAESIKKNGVQIISQLKELKIKYEHQQVTDSQGQSLNIGGIIDTVLGSYIEFERQSLENGIYNYDQLATLRQVNEPVVLSMKAFRDDLYVLLEKVENLENSVRKAMVQKSHSRADTFQNSFIIIGIFSILIILASISIVNSIIKRLYKLINFIYDAEKNGDFSKTLLINSNDEVGQVASALNGMMGSLQKAFDDVNRVMGAVADGVLTEQIHSDHQGNLDGSIINKAIQMLEQTISRIEDSGNMIHIGTDELTQTSKELADGTSQQADSIEQITTAMVEIESRTSINNENAFNAQQFSDQAQTIVENGNQQMIAMLDSMKKINDTSSDVSKIIKVIDEIAFQTNLLALNAAVEAARAGKYGKGFAVVADEVRNLAARSAEAAKQTSDLISSSEKEVDKGVVNADQTAAILGEISEFVKKTNGLVSQIVDATKVQKQEVQEINTSLSKVNNIVQNSSSISRDTAGVAEQLRDQVYQMRESLGKFKINNKKQTKSDFQYNLASEGDRPTQRLLDIN